MSSSSRKFETHRDAAKAENIKFLLESGLIKEDVAKRLGITVDNLDKTLERERKRK